MRKFISYIAMLILAGGISSANAEIFLPGKTLRDAREALANRDYQQTIRLADEVHDRSQNAITRLEALALLTEATGATGKFSACDRYFNEAVNILSENPELIESDEYTNTVFNYAQFLQSMGQFNQAYNLLDSLRFPVNSEGEARRIGALATNLYRSGAPADGFALLDSLLSNYSGPSYPTLLQNRGYMLDGMGRHAEAYQNLIDASDLIEGKDKGVTMANAAVALSRAGSNPEALNLIDQALDTLRNSVGEKDADYIIALRKKAEILVNAGDKDGATIRMKDFFTREKSRLSELLPTLSPQMRVDYWTKEKPLLSKCFIIGDTDPEFLMDVALTRRQTSLIGERYRGIASMDASSKDLRKLLDNDDAAVAFVRYEDADADIKYAAIVLTKTGKPAFLELFSEKEIYSALPDSNFSLYDIITNEDPAGLNRLYTDTAIANRIWQPIIEALPYHIRNIHFAPEGIFHLWGIENLPFDNSEKYSLIRHFSLLDEDGYRKDSDTARTSINNGNILVAGGLDYDKEAGQENDAASPADINIDAYTELKRNISPTYTGKIFSYLPGTASEAKSLAALLDNAALTDSIDEKSFKRNAGSFNALHLATHGYALDSGIASAGQIDMDSEGIDLTLLRSGIALSGANVLATAGAAEDGILSAREIYDMDLADVDMVVLSACQTAKGVISDESASGLIRALKNAGVKIIVATLWEVDDAATSLFMQSFYKALAQGMNPQKAIETARRNISGLTKEIPLRSFSPAAMASRPNGKTKEVAPYSNPWYWAPFILIY